MTGAALRHREQRRRAGRLLYETSSVDRHMSDLHPVQRPATRVPSYVAPRTLHEALALKAEHGAAARPIAGGTDLVVELDRGAHAGAELLIDLSRIAALADITVTADEIRLGAITTHHDVV